jgi:hypothetical protein
MTANPGDEPDLLINAVRTGAGRSLLLTTQKEHA